MTDRQYFGAGDERIAYAGDVWLVGPDGLAVNLEPFEGDLPHGTFAPVNSEYGIQRDDELDIFESDFDAARAIADHLTTITGLDYTIWYEATDKETTP